MINVNLEQLSENEILDWGKKLINPINIQIVVNTAYSKVWCLYDKNEVFYLKATIGELQLEPVMYQLVTRVVGLGCCPEVIGINHDLGCFLTKSIGNQTLREKFETNGFEIDLVCKAYEAMCELQYKMSDSLQECIKCGSADWRGNSMSQEFLAMLQKPDFSKDHNLGLRELDQYQLGVEILLNARNEIASVIPRDFWSDDDFNDKNIVVNGVNYGFVDLGETSVGPPLIGLYSSLSWLKRKYSIAENSIEDMKLRDSCLVKKHIHFIFHCVCID
jgi:hypothetical protein